jgi:hypothetical protein
MRDPGRCRSLTIWDSIDAVKAFAGDDYERAVVEPVVRDLSESLRRARHALHGCARSLDALAAAGFDRKAIQPSATSQAKTSMTRMRSVRPATLRAAAIASQSKLAKKTTLKSSVGGPARTSQLPKRCHHFLSRTSSPIPSGLSKPAHAHAAWRSTDLRIASSLARADELRGRLTTTANA